ncbi:glycine-rich domain-containing protein [Bradyrhizobium elkanii]|uniref:glycine-rich domain-containing protein n=1 Tax=Bradyrhizobium elkanii TaxID=29448 RepID=UPI000686D2E7|nr:hypothetical protein [Bradyrhizobium elkanii]WLA79563.1 hypothetical protein QNJ99_29725 [Bradyrhizobium elkanii]
MTAMFPGSGVPPADARNSLPDPDTRNCDELWYSTSRCQPRFDPAAANAVLAELINLINKGEVSYDCQFLDQVQLSVRYLIQRGLPRGALIASGPSAYVGVLDPPLTRFNDFMELTVVPNVSNAGAASVDFGQGVKSLLRNDALQLGANDLLGGVPVDIAYYQGNWYVVSLVRSQIAALMQQVGTNTVVYVSGAGNFIVPANIYMLREVELTGGGGGGGGGGPAGGGGNGGSTVRGSMPVFPGQVIPWVVGVGGTPGTPATDGGPGSNTSFGGWIAAAGQGGHTNGNPGSAGASNVGGTEQYTGQQADAGWILPTEAINRGGHGGNTISGGLGGQGSQNGGTNGNPGSIPGGAGGGGSSGAGGVLTSGGPGGGGRILIRY